MTLKQKMINQNKLEQYEIVRKFYEDYFLLVETRAETVININYYNNQWSKEHSVKFSIVEMLLDLLQNFEYSGKIINNLVDDSNISITESFTILEGIICNNINAIYIYTFYILFFNEHHFKRENLAFTNDDKKIMVDFFSSVLYSKEYEFNICYEIAKNTILNNSDIKTEVEKWSNENQDLLENGYFNEEEWEQTDWGCEYEECMSSIFQEFHDFDNLLTWYDIEKICKKNYCVSILKQSEEFWEYLIDANDSELKTLSTFDFLEFLKK